MTAAGHEGKRLFGIWKKQKKAWWSITKAGAQHIEAGYVIYLS